MHLDLVDAVGAFCALPLGDLDQVGLQQRAVQARTLAQRLLGCADHTLGELHARYQGLVLEHPDTEAVLPTHRSLQGWWRDASTQTGAQAGADVRRAAKLRDLPLLAQAVTDGKLGQEQAQVLIRLHGRIPLDALVDSQPQLLQVARTVNAQALGRFVAHLIATHCEPALDDDQSRAQERRYLQLRHEPDGTVRGSFALASEDAEAVLTVLEPLARKQGDTDSRSAGQRRADALVEVFGAAANWMDLPHAGGQRAQVSYVLTGEWCAGEQPLGLPDALVRAGTLAGLHPAALDRYAPDGAWTGPQTRSRVEAVLCDARISRLLLDPHGAIVSLESLTDQITTAQRRAVSIRDRHCVAKGCTRPPAFCDVHHLTHREHGGITAVDNLVLLRLSHEWRAFPLMNTEDGKMPHGCERAWWRRRSTAADAPVGAGLAA